jgi:hypothetical protein
MGRVVGLAAALALAACQVDVDGAVCAEPGTTTDCPSGQACGNDLRCSARALGCVATRCTPGPVFCAARDGTEAYGCVDADPVCGAPAKVSCFDSLGEALAKAAAHARESGAPTTVSIQGGPGADVVFGLETGEVFPLEVAEGVTLVGAGAPAGASVIRAGEAPSILAVSGAVRGLRVESEGAAGTGIAVSCGSGGTVPTLVDVSVVGGGMLETGVRIDGGRCGATLAGIDVWGAVDAALSVQANEGVAVTVERSRFRESGLGILATGGKLTVGGDDPAAAVEVTGNVRDGVVLTGGVAKTLEIELRRVHVTGNLGTGVVLETVALASKVAVDRCVIHGNGAITPRTYGLDGSIRTGGGILVLQNDGLASFAFAGNRVYSNAGDQIGVWSDATWSLGPVACGPASNALGCAAPGAFAVSVVGNATVRAEYNVWSSSQPAGLVSGATWNPPCAANANGAPLALPCPSP